MMRSLKKQRVRLSDQTTDDQVAGVTPIARRLVQTLGAGASTTRRTTAQRDNWECDWMPAAVAAGRTGHLSGLGPSMSERSGHSP